MHRRVTAILIGSIALGALVSQCAPSQRALPGAPDWDPGDGCIGIGFEATLVGSSSDPRLAWAVQGNRATRIDLAWPSGFEARFAPGLEILDPEGRVIARAGDSLTGGCPAEVDGIEVMKVDATDIAGAPGA